VSVGFLPPGTVLDPKKSVREHVEDAIAGKRALLTRFEELSMKLGEEMSEAEMDKVLPSRRACRIRSRPQARGSGQGRRDRDGRTAPAAR